ncbi:MAG TPA: chloride channel protein [Gemmataceae bacterium]|nr:chloride channel protein [Gemmataceae bacterium]
MQNSILTSQATAARSADEARRQREFRRLLEMCGLACGIGVLGAPAAFALQAAIVLATNVFFRGRWSFEPICQADHHLGLLVVFIPPLGGLIVGVLARYGSPSIRGHGIPETMETILVSRSRIAPRLAVLKPLATAISIGSGGPFGAEGPIIQTGGALGSLLGQTNQTTAAERKVLVAAGAAAGMAATFNAPVAAVFLAVELLLFELRVRSLLPVALASAVAAGLRWLVQGTAPLYPVAAEHVLSGWQLPLCALLGVCAGLLAVGLSRSIYLIEDLFERLPVHWMWWPVLGGAVVGLVGLVFPQALGVGAEHVRAMAASQATFGFLLAMLLCKTVAWTVSLGSGTSGGVLGPLLLIGGALGGTLAGLANGVAAGTAEPGLWSVLCMAAVFAGATRAPLTSIVFAMELTHDAGIFLPLLVACAVSDLVSVGMLRHSIMTEKIARRGVSIGHEYELDALALFTVSQVMTTEVETVPMSLPLRRFLDRVYVQQTRAKHQGYPVVDETGRLVSMVTRSDLPEYAWREDLGWLVVADIMSTRPVIVAWPDEPLRLAAEHMLQAGVGRLPVVPPDQPERVVGILTRGDVLKALAQRAEDENKRERLIRGTAPKAA